MAPVAGFFHFSVSATSSSHSFVVWNRYQARVARLFYWEVRSKEEAVLLSCHRKQQIFYTMLKDKGLLKKRTMFIFISFKQKSWVQHVKTRAPVAAPPPLPTGGGYPFTLLVKFKLWNLIIFMLSIVFQQLSRNFAHVCFCFRQEVDEHHPRHHTKKGLVPGTSGNSV